MALHVMNKLDQNAWLSMQSALAAEDAVLLIENAVYAAMPDHPLAALTAALSNKVTCHALTEDLAARGISDRILPGFANVTYRDFVALSLKHPRVVSW